MARVAKRRPPRPDATKALLRGNCVVSQPGHPRYPSAVGTRDSQDRPPNRWTILGMTQRARVVTPDKGRRNDLAGANWIPRDLAVAARPRAADSSLEDTADPQPLFVLFRRPHQQHRHHAIEREMP